MPPPLQFSPSNLKSIHLLRALLREASYLPDANARTYFRHYIVARFKAYQPKRNATRVERPKDVGFSRRNNSTITERTRPKQRKAQKGLNYLRRVNLGERSCLEKVMFFAYGRVGKRRYALLEKLLGPDAPPEGESAPLQQLYYSNQRFLQFFDAPEKKTDAELTIDISTRYPRLHAVVKSQVVRGISMHRAIKGPKLTTSRLNAWERPMPIKRARNDVKRWYADTMSKLLPPLPDDEYNKLRGLASGEEKWTDSIPRRISAKSVDSPADDFELPHSVLQDGLALNKPSKADRPGGKQRPHNVTPRMMRRLYARILHLSCKLEWNEERSKWTATWGTLKDTTLKVYSAPVDEALFAGVDRSGRRIAQP
ncbi:hypothetical protein K491DRAFT_608128 [Lophiostoma macrostomum CBS 122681]|uniref:LYR motif-containing protein Cup1-like N-terminal domain-containing protein n=1 Tax=Lophiostoma macrostomum CBS 122681 TaxID=1314788 RepID=A0A6A6SUU4_9PLEO|nr:hypothetical protein K491DRAFT_608128 [Lophiostoma macrostomum CBS 122681]